MEGINLNYCDKLIIVSDAMSIPLDRLKQLIGRVVRQSAVYKHIDILIYSMSYVNIARGLLVNVDVSNADISSDIVVKYYIEKYGIEHLSQLPKIVRMFLLCQFMVPEYNDDKSGINELIKYI